MPGDAGDSSEEDDPLIVEAVVVGCALVAAVVAVTIASRVPDFDPGAPRPATPAIRREVIKHPGFAAIVRSRFEPSTVTGLALTVALALVLGGAVAIGALLVMVQHNAGLAHCDLSAARWGSSYATTGSTKFLRDVTMLGGTPATIAVALVTAVAVYARTRRMVVFRFLAVVVAGQAVVSNLTKVLVNRSRPDIHRLTGVSGSSFPSGHATTAAATFAAVALLLGMGHTRRTKALLAGAAAGIAVAVATTRVLLGVHWLTDVLAGLALGWAWFAASSIAFGGRLLSFGQPVEAARSGRPIVG